MIRHLITADVNRALARQAAEALIGLRQVGKTTLALSIGEERGALYLDLEDRDDRTRLAGPVLFLEAAEDRLVILDEIQPKPAEMSAQIRGEAAVENVCKRERTRLRKHGWR